MACVYIPVQNSEEEVRVALDQLPRDASDILDILKAEQAPLDLWLIIAREYFKQGKIDQFRQILEEGSSPEIDEYYADVRYERIAILNALGAYYSYLGKIETKQREKEENFIMATQYYNKASRIDMHEPSTWVGKGQLLLAKGDIEQAFAAFKIVLDGDRDNVPALLGQACVQFSRGRYSDSLELYKRALQVYPDCPAAVRLGIGLCRYKLGQLEKAKQAFCRVLQLDPENVDALVALAILDLQNNEVSGIRRGMEKMQRAFEMYPYCAIALNYLANHFFFTGQHFLVEQLMETALAVTTHGPTKSHSYYNLARSYHSKGDYEKAGMYYMASVKESRKPYEFVLPYYGLGQVQLKLGDLRSSLANFEKVLEVYPESCETVKALAHIYVQLGQAEKVQEYLKKATKIDPRDPQAFLDIGELLISNDPTAALEAFKTARNLLRKTNEEVPIELLNNIGVLHFEREEFELASQSFKEALGDGVWIRFLDAKAGSDGPTSGGFLYPNGQAQSDLFKSAQYSIDASASVRQYKDFQLFHRLEEQGSAVELPWNKVSTLFNMARLLEQLHDTETASIFYRLIIFKYPAYADAYLRLAAIAKARNNVQLSNELINDALKVNEKCPDALLMLGDLELKNDDWVKAKETFRAAKDATDGNDSYATLCLGNWNYFAAIRNEKRAPKLEATHLEKAKELYTKVLFQHNANLYAANGAGVVLAEKGQFDISKDLFTQVQEAASGNVFVQMPDVWINLAHVHFAQGNFALAVKMYQNCLRKFYHNTDSQVLLYLARTHYEAEQWQDCKKTLLRAIHLAPSNYTLRFDTGVALQKFSASTLQKTKRTVDEVRSTVAELKNAVRLFSLLSAASNLHVHGFDEKKIETHVGYCKHLLEAAKVHCEAAEREDQQNKQRLELARQVTLAEENRRKAEEQRKYQLERRKQEDELKQVMQQEQHLERVKEQWKSGTPASKRKDRSQNEDDEGGHGERRKKKGGKRRKRDKKSHYESEEAEAEMDDQEEVDDVDRNRNYEESYYQTNDQAENNPQDLLLAAGLEDSDAEDDTVAPSSNASRRRQALSESDEDEPLQRQGSAFTVIGELYSRFGSSLPVDTWQSTIEILRNILETVASKGLVKEDGATARFYTSLLHCLHLVLIDSKGPLSGHVAGFVVTLRNFIHYGLANKSHNMFALTDKKQITSVSIKTDLTESTTSQTGRYMPPHLRNKNLKSFQLEDEKSLTMSSDSESSDSDGSGRGACNTPYGKTRLAAIICIQDLCLADPKSFTAQWTMLLPSSDVLQPRRYEATLMSCLLFDPFLKARVAAASAIRAMLDAPPSVFLQVAEFKESAKCGSFMALSSSLGQILMQLHSGTLYLIKHETHSGLLASLFKILMLLISSTPYSRMPRELLPTVVSSIQARIEEGFSYRSDQNILLATTINCLSAALSVSPSSIEVKDMLLAEVAAGSMSTQSKLGIFSTLFQYCEPGVSSSVGFEALQAVRAVAHNYPSVMVLCWDKIFLLVHRFLTFSSETRSWRDNVGNSNEQIGDKVITASIKVLDECLRAISGFKGTEDHSSDMSLDSPFTSDYVKLKTISSAPSYGPHDSAVNSDGAEKLAGSEQWLEAIVRHLPLILQHSSPMVRAASVTCFAGITSSVFFSLPKDKQDFILNSCVKTAKGDEVPNVRSAACRAIGVIACFPHIFHSAEIFDKFISPAVDNSHDSSVSVRITASWALANICDALRHHVDVHGFEKFSSVSSQSISLLIDCALQLTNDNDKVKANAVRALGNLSRVVRFSSQSFAYNRQADSMVVSSGRKPTKGLSICEDLEESRSPCNAPLENSKWLEKMVQAFISCVTTGNVKVQWNVCYSLSNLFSNPSLKLENMVWASSVFSILLLLLRDSSNFKIRIQAAAALAVPATLNDYGRSFLSVLQGVQHVVESLNSDEISSPSNLKYRLALEKQLTSTMLHLLGLTSKTVDRHVHEFLMKKSSFFEEWLKLVCMSLEKSPNQFEAEYYSSVNHKKDVIFRAVRSLIEVYEAHDLHAAVQRFHKLSNIL